MRLIIKYKNGYTGYYEVNRVEVDKDVDVINFNAHNTIHYTVHTKDLNLVKLDEDVLYIDYENYM